MENLMLTSNERNSSRDLILKKRIQDKIRWDKRVSSSDVHVLTRSGQVTLFGKVDTAWRMKAAVDIVGSVKGVTKVINQVEVPSVFNRTDNEFKNLLERKMEAVTSKESDLITVRVENGCVTLEGTVDTARKKATAAAYVWELSGIKDCCNKVLIHEPRVSTSTGAKTVPQSELIWRGHAGFGIPLMV